MRWRWNLRTRHSTARKRSKLKRENSWAQCPVLNATVSVYDFFSLTLHTNFRLRKKELFSQFTLILPLFSGRSIQRSENQKHVVGPFLISENACESAVPDSLLVDNCLPSWNSGFYFFHSFVSIFTEFLAEISWLLSSFSCNVIRMGSPNKYNYMFCYKILLDN